MMLRTVNIYGTLGRKYGYRHRFDVATVQEAVSALSANYKGFRQEFTSGAYTVVRGRTRREGNLLEAMEMGIQLGKHDIHITPVAFGHGGGGHQSTGKTVGKIVLGVAMVAGAFFTAGASTPFGLAAFGGDAAGGEAVTAGAAAAEGAGGLSAEAINIPIIGSISYGRIAATGAMLALSGIAGLISPTAQATPNYERPEARASFIYNGPANTSEQGGAIAAIYGLIRVGSTLVSGAISTDQIIYVDAQNGGLETIQEDPNQTP